MSLRRLTPTVLLVLAAAGACRRDDAPPPAGSAPTPKAPAASAPAVDAAVSDLRERVAALGGRGELLLPAGTYLLEPQNQVDTACALCPGDGVVPDLPAITVGLKVSGEGVRIVGEGAGRTIIRTRSGYGVLFDGCKDCELAGVTITDGNRDADERASDAAVVVRSSSVRLRDCSLSDNLGAEFLVAQSFVGISGIVVREGGQAILERCRITRNSWDGATVLRGGRLELRDCVIDGVDKAQGRTLGGGRGIGVRVATGGAALLDGVLIARHAGGAAVYGASRLELRDTVVEESTAWGVIAQEDASGAPELRAEGLAVNRVASCGLAVHGATTGAVAQVRVLRAAEGGRGPCESAALDVAAGFSLADAASWLTGGRPDQPGDADAAAFRQGSAALVQRLAARQATAESRFVLDCR